MSRALLINSYGQRGQFTLSNVKKSVCFSGKLWIVQILEGTFLGYFILILQKLFCNCVNIRRQSLRLVIVQREANVIPSCNRVSVAAAAAAAGTCLKVKCMFTMSSKFCIVNWLKEVQQMHGRSKSQTQLSAGSFTLISCQPMIDQF